MLSVLIVSDNKNHKFIELEECLINDYHIDYSIELLPDPAELSQIEFSYEIIFYLKRPENKEIPAISRLAKSKIMIFRVKSGYQCILDIRDVVPVSNQVTLNATAMRGDLRYFRGVDKIFGIDAYHMEVDGCEVVLNGNRDTKAMLGDITFRMGKNVIFGVLKDNIAIFSLDIFSNDAMKRGDNCKFIRNLLKKMIGSAELY